MTILCKNSKGERPWEGALALWGGGESLPVAMTRYRVFNLLDFQLYPGQLLFASNRGRYLKVF